MCYIKILRRLENIKMRDLVKIAKKIISRSQIVKTCVIDQDNNCTCYLEEMIFLQPFTYNYAGLQMDIEQFAKDINNELDNIKFGKCNIDDIKLSIEENGLLKFSYKKGRLISDEEKEIIRSYEWRIQE